LHQPACSNIANRRNSGQRLKLSSVGSVRRLIADHRDAAGEDRFVDVVDTAVGQERRPLNDSITHRNTPTQAWGREMHNAVKFRRLGSLSLREG